ncbi:MULTISPECIES: porin [Burkholderia]|nr:MULTISPECIES: porin [Burkholderia]
MGSQQAFAQSSVTLYGSLDAGLLYTSRTAGGGAHQFSMVDSGTSASEFGIRGSEDLGGGLKAIFVLESGISTSNGGFSNSNGNFFGRKAWFGIKGDFGTVQAGLQYSPFVLSIINSDPRNVSFFGSGAVVYVGNVLGTGYLNPNAVTYTSPDLAGLQGSAMLALGGTAGDFQAGRQYSARLKYDIHSLTIDAAFYSGNEGGTAAFTPLPTTIAFTGRTVGVGYALGNLTIKASFVNYKVAGSFDSRVFGGGLSYFVTPVFNLDAGAWYTSDGNNTVNHSVLTGAGIDYFMSKQTTLYGQVAFVNNHGKMKTGLSVNGALYAGEGSTAGAVIGIRHTF